MVVWSLLGAFDGDGDGDGDGSFSIAAEIIGTMILAGTLAHNANIESAESYVFFPLVIHAVDLVISAVGIMLVQSNNEREVSS